MSVQSLIERGIVEVALPTDRRGRIQWVTTTQVQRAAFYRSTLKALPIFKSDLSRWTQLEAKRRGLGCLDYIHKSMLDYNWFGPFELPDNQAPYGIMGQYLPASWWMQ